MHDPRMSCRLASRVMCATLAVPIPHNEDQLLQDDNAMEKKKRLANLLGLQSPPTRANLVKDLVCLNAPLTHTHISIQDSPPLGELGGYICIHCSPFTRITSAVHCHTPSWIL